MQVTSRTGRRRRAGQPATEPATEPHLPLAVRIGVVALLIAIIVGVTLGRPALQELPPVERVDRIEIRGSGRVLGEIRDPTRVAAIVAFRNARLTNWTEARGTPPSAPVRVVFSAAGETQGAFGATREFFTWTLNGQNFTRSADRRETAAFHRLLGTPEPVR